MTLETVSSEHLEDPPAIDSTLIFPESLFTSALNRTNFSCSEVGVVAVVTDGAGPLLSYDSNILPECMPTEAPRSNGKWYVLQRLKFLSKLGHSVITCECARNQIAVILYIGSHLPSSRPPPVLETPAPPPSTQLYASPHRHTSYTVKNK